jgi:oligosaccharide repeat unit polymerase
MSFAGRRGGRIVVKSKSGTTSLRRRTGSATIIFLLGLVLTYIALPSSDGVEAVFTVAAVGIGLSLTIATALEGAAGVRALIRVDILMLWVLYGLTFLEFLFPQPDVENSLSSDMATKGVLAAMLGFAGLALGRHIVPWRQKSEIAFYSEAPPRVIFLLFIVAAMLGYLHILLAVNFDVLEMFRQMSLPRFEQSWTRGRYGGNIQSLLTEIGALLYLIPPIAGFIYARTREYGITQKVTVTIVLFLTFYYALSSGARSILVVYVISFFGAYYLNRPKIKLWLVATQGCIILLCLLVVIYLMLEFRNVGISDFSFSNRSRDTLYIDHNMVVISQLADAYPKLHNFLGFEIPYHALVHPIPRAFWPGKPEGLSVTVESIVGTDQATIASTFIGEAYMMAGMFGVLLVAILFGAAAEMWNRVGRDANSAFSQLLYASGFFCAIISMRSMLWTTVTMLPTLALWLYGRIWLGGTSPVRRSPPPKQS